MIRLLEADRWMAQVVLKRQPALTPEEQLAGGFIELDPTAKGVWFKSATDVVNRCMENGVMINGDRVTEHLQVAVFPFARVLEMVRQREILDAMTVVAVLHMALRVATNRRGST
jgi:hypothetical protein